MQTGSDLGSRIPKLPSEFDLCTNESHPLTRSSPCEAAPGSPSPGCHPLKTRRDGRRSRPRRPDRIPRSSGKQRWRAHFLAPAAPASAPPRQRHSPLRKTVGIDGRHRSLRPSSPSRDERRLCRRPRFARRLVPFRSFPPPQHHPQTPRKKPDAYSRCEISSLKLRVASVQNQRPRP